MPASKSREAIRRATSRIRRGWTIRTRAERAGAADAMQLRLAAAFGLVPAVAPEPSRRERR